jgi:mono/diheme cytochrome c family protein
MTRIAILAALASLVTAACDSKPAADPKIAAEAKNVWETRCVACHGPRGAGDGPGAVALKAKPRSFNNAKWQSDTDDDRIRTVIVGGGESVGLSAEMTPNPDLADKPDVVNELLRIVRSFG